MPLQARPDTDFDPLLARREAARLLLLDGDGRVLLLRSAAPDTEPHWSGPGGGLEPGEEPAAALARELLEEVSPPLRLRAAAAGTWRHQFVRHGRPVVQHEQLFVAALPAGPPPEALSPGPEAAADSITELRWFTAQEVRECPEDVWPDDLAAWLDARQRARG